MNWDIMIRHLKKLLTVTGAIRWALIAPVTKQRTLSILARLIVQELHVVIIIPGPRELIYQGCKGPQKQDANPVLPFSEARALPLYVEENIKLAFTSPYHPEQGYPSGPLPSRQPGWMHLSNATSLPQRPIVVLQPLPGCSDAWLPTDTFLLIRKTSTMQKWSKNTEQVAPGFHSGYWNLETISWITTLYLFPF